MTTTQATPQPTSGGASHHQHQHQHRPASSSANNTSSSSSSSSSSWIPPIPRPLESLFAAVPLVVYAANNLPSGSPAPSSLPALHVFASDHDAARGLPSFNPSCLKWQTYLRLASIPHHLVSSTNHASPTGSLPFLQPAIATGPEARLDARQLLPIPSSRLDAYVRQHGSLPSSSIPSSIPPSKSPPKSKQTPDQRHHRQQAYQALLDTPIRNAWLYTLYLSPANEALVRDLYINPTSRSALVRATLLQQLRAAARAEIGKSGETTSSSSSNNEGGDHGGSIASTLFTWALGGRAAVNAEAVYAAARSALLALETLLAQSASDTDFIDGHQNWDDQNEEDLGTNDPSGGDPSAAAARGGPWFFSTMHPTLFDASVFSYTYLILHGDRYSGSGGASSGTGVVANQQGEKDTHWGDDTLRQILLHECPYLVAHVQRIVERCWGADGAGMNYKVNSS